MLGKLVFNELYLHIDYLEQCAGIDSIRSFIQHVLKSEAFLAVSPNVLKINLKTNKFSLLHYQNFNEDAFPSLLISWVVEVANDHYKLSIRKYDNSLNPPILHRKELLVNSSHPLYSQWCETTTLAESLGLFDETTTIGFKLNWQRLIQSRGYELINNQFVPIGNSTSFEVADEASSDGSPTVNRHMTALYRSNLSAPVQALLRHGILKKESSFFDYGCGRGDDLASLINAGYNAVGWDPHYQPDLPRISSDIVNIGFVLNVIEDPAERIEALASAFKLAKQALVVAVMLYTPDIKGKPYKDGVLTSRNTFQKYFTQTELKDYIEHALNRTAFMLAPGIAVIFANDEYEQMFSMNRLRNKTLTSRLLGGNFVHPHKLREKRQPKSLTPKLPKPIDTELQDLLKKYWLQTLELGRWPEADEFENCTELFNKVSSLKRTQRLIALNEDLNLLEKATKARADEVLLLFVERAFDQQKPYRRLETRLQRDIKSFFGKYEIALAKALELLKATANQELILKACQQASEEGLGWLEDDHSLQLHISMLPRLPAILRAYVICGLVLWGALGEVQLVKIHIGSGKLTLLEIENFDESPLPLVKQRVKLNLFKLDYDVFDYGSEQFPKPIMYRKHRYLNEEYPHFAEQQVFDETLENLGFFENDLHGPKKEVLFKKLDSMRLEIKDFQIMASTYIPNLDQACGVNFTYRDFIECGETQAELKLPNLPKQAQSYNALYQLASQVLDPVIDYFGSIDLTYGFCSPELGKHIKARVAPKLDQHASYEVNSKGNLICERRGAACDFIVQDEDMFEVAQWISENLEFDRIYVYEKNRPIHVSIGPENSKSVYHMELKESGKRVPKVFKF